MFTQNFIKPSAAVHELSCPQTVLPYLTKVKNHKIWSCDLDLDLWPWNSIRFVRLSRHMFIELSAAVHELSY